MDLDAQAVRRRLRRRITPNPDSPIIATGHQPDFIHAGVWAKHVVAQRLAQATGGVAVNLVVDHDAPVRLAFDCPRFEQGSLAVHTIGYAQWPLGAAIEAMPPASADDCDRLESQLRHNLGDYFSRSQMPAFLAEYRQHVAACDWVDQAVAARRGVESRLGVEVADHRVSALWVGPLLGQMLIDARAFAKCHNEALTAYRRANRVRGAQRPVADLAMEPDRCEVAAWAYRPGEKRRRLFVSAGADRLELFAGEERIAALDSDTMRHWDAMETALSRMLPWRIRPRALTLTLWARLLLCDLFIHGIGGARYDQVTDDIIRRYFRIDPPAMACVSATLHLPLSHDPVSMADVRKTRHRLRDIAFNPQRHVDRDLVRELADARESAVQLSGRLRREDPGNGIARRHAFNEIRAWNERILAAFPEPRLELIRELAALQSRQRRSDIAHRRDYFFGLHTRETLQELLDGLPSVQDQQG